MSSVIEVTSENWQEEVLNSDVPVIVDFWAEWCGPCRAVGPVLDEIAKESEGQMKVAKVNVEVDTELSSKYGVRSIPHFLVIKDGEIKGQFPGSMGKQDLVAKIESYLK